MKILFLDIDGVVNCKTTTQRHRGFIGIDPFMAFQVGRIALWSGCQIVLSSSWRHFEGGIEEVKKQVGDILDVTPTAESGFRGDDIKMWLEKHPEVTKYAILDDDDDFYDDQKLKLFKTSWETGITEEIANDVINYFEH